MTDYSVRASLYPGKIQQAKALVAERYLTNPLCAAPIAGLDARTTGASELRGRPLTVRSCCASTRPTALTGPESKDVQLAAPLPLLDPAQVTPVFPSLSAKLELFR